MARRSFISALLVLLTVAVYWRVWLFDFVNFDDPVYVTENRHVLGGLTWANIRWSLTSSYAANWFPLTWISLMCDASVWGTVKETPAGGYHLTNLLLHLANVVLLFLLLQESTKAVWRSALVAALFAVHPLHVESVAWVTERKDVLSTFWGLISLWMYCRYALRHQRKWYLASLAAFTVSLTAKQMLVTMPFLLLLFDIWPLGRFAHTDLAGETSGVRPKTRKEILLEKLPFLLLAGLSAVIVFVVQQRGGTVQSFEQIRLGLRLSNAVVVSLLYFLQMAWPFDLAIFYPYPAGGIALVEVLGAAGLLIGISVVALKLVRSRSYLLAGWLWYLVTLVPVIGIVQVGSQRMADRYTYIPSIGLFFAIVWLIADIMPKGFARRIALPVGWVGILILLAVIAFRQVRYWQNSITLFERTVAVTKNNPLAHTNLGNALRNIGRTEEAIRHFRTALEINPNYASAHNNLGVELLARNEAEEALEHFRLAVRIDPAFAMAYFNLAGLLRDRGEIEESSQLYRRALQLDPENVNYLINLANVLRAQGLHGEAVSYLETACRLEPNNATAHVNLGIACFQQQRIDEGIFHLREASLLDPESEAAHFNLATALYGLRRFPEAAGHFRRVLEINPQHAAAISSLASTLGALGDLNGAIEQFQSLVKLSPENWQAHFNLAKALATRKDYQGAKEHYLKTLQRQPELAAAHNELGLVLLELGDRAEAVKAFRAALRLKPDFPDAQRNLDAALKIAQ